MTFREVSMVELKEVLRQWLGGAGKKRIAARVGMDPKTVRRYVRAAEACGLRAGAGESTLSDEGFAAIVAALSVVPTREHGDAWRCCEEHREFIEDKLKDRVKLTKIRRLLRRQHVVVCWSTDFSLRKSRRSEPVDRTPLGSRDRLELPSERRPDLALRVRRARLRCSADRAHTTALALRPETPVFARRYAARRSLTMGRRPVRKLNPRRIMRQPAGRT